MKHNEVVVTSFHVQLIHGKTVSFDHNFFLQCQRSIRE
jgi:hypothetical protein